MIENGQVSLLMSYQRLVELARDLVSELDLSTLLNRIVTAAAELSNAEAASILLFDETKKELYFEAATNMESPFMRGLVVPIDSSIAGWIFTQRQLVNLSQAQNDPRLFNGIGQVTHLPTRSLLGIPLINKDKVIGVLEAINKRSGEFSQQDEEILTALGVQAAVALENARLFQQSDLIAELVHELRTPLGSLTAGAHLLQRQDVSAGQSQSIVQTMIREIERLTNLSSAFLDLAKLESGRSQFNPTTFNLADLIGECAELMLNKAAEKQQTLEIFAQGPLPPLIADRDMVKRLLINLVNNAINYTPNGGRIKLSTWQSSEGILLQVTDSGIGIPEESLPHLFTKFYRVPSTAGSATGTGLGLLICKRIVETHRGKIEVASKPGEGTTFTVSLPAVKPAN